MLVEPSNLTFDAGDRRKRVANVKPAPVAPAFRTPVSWLNHQPYLLLTLTSLFWAGNTCSPATSQATSRR